jgi:hypothetical protein
VVQYKRDTTMPAFEVEKMDPVAAFDPFQPNLKELQLKDTDLQAIFLYLKNGSWLPHLTKLQIKLLALLAQKVFFDKNNLAWIHLDDYKYSRTALSLWLPEFYRKEALCESHDHLFAGHNAAQKTYIKLTTSYFWPNAYSHVLKHTQTCLR